MNQCAKIHDDIPSAPRAWKQSFMTIWRKRDTFDVRMPFCPEQPGRMGARIAYNADFAPAVEPLAQIESSLSDNP